LCAATTPDSSRKSPTSGRSLASDRRTKAKTTVKKGEGDRGYQKQTKKGR